MIKVLICDDSALMRKVLKRIIEDDPALEVIGMARNGDDAVEKARELRPDVITMDINMPGMDGITALQYIKEENIAPVLMVSSLTQEGAEATVEALILGAFDFVGKPGGTVSNDMSSVAQELTDKLKAAKRTGKRGLSAEKTRRKRSTSTKRVPPSRTSSRKVKSSSGIGYKAVAIGISTGGPKTIFNVLPYLPEDLNAAVFLTQHIPATFISNYAKRIDKNCNMPCIEAKAGLKVEPGIIYLATGDKHLALRKNISGDIIIRTPSKPDMAFVPSVSVMMESVLSVFGADTIGVEMTGMGSDGADSMLKIKEAGGATIAESEETAIVFGMPKSAIDLGGASIVLPHYEIADEIIKEVER